MVDNNTNSNENNPRPASDILRRKKGFMRIQIINLIIAATAILTLTWFVWSFFIARAETHKPCEALKIRKELVIARIKELDEKKESSPDKDFNEKYYEFEITYANAELRNILDSIKLMLCKD
jgi:hypothetical protein